MPKIWPQSAASTAISASSSSVGLILMAQSAIAKTSFSPVADINAGNIGYKIAQRMGNFEAYGPILLGLNSPINDLSRGCNADEVYSMAIITAALVDMEEGE